MHPPRRRPDVYRASASALAASAALLLLLAAPVAAQEWAGRGRLQGKVTGPGGEPIAEARVALRQGDATGPGPEVILTNDKGRWSYLGLGNGQWTVTVEADGYVPREGSFAVTEYGSNPSVNIELRPLTEEMTAASEPNPALAAIEAGNAHLEAGRPAEARAAYESALATLEPESHPPVLRGVARAYYEEGDKDAAIATLEKALAIDPADEDTLRLVINLLVAADREAEAEAYMARLPEGAEVEPETLLNVGIKAFNEGDLEAALASFDRVVVQNPELAEAYYYRGLAHLNSTHHPQALADFERFLSLDPDHARAEEARQFVEYLQSQTAE